MISEAATETRIDFCGLDMSVVIWLLGCLTESAAKKPTEMTLIRKSAFGRHVGD
jgi:hypothetical protein